jgi:hypothetical protein
VYPNIEKMMFESERYPVLRLSYKQQLAFLEDCWFIAEDPVSKVYSDVVNSHTRNNAAEQESSEDDILSMLN